MTTTQTGDLDRWTGLRDLGADSPGTDPTLSDAGAILDAVDLPIVVLRRDFTVGCFNQAAENLLGLAPPHLGLIPGDVPALAGMADFKVSCEDVMAGGPPRRVDFRAGDKRFVVRIAPYATAGQPATGAVLTFINVTAFRASIDQAIYEREYTKAILNAVADPLVVLDEGLRVQSGNRAFHAIFRVSRDRVLGMSLSNLCEGAFNLPRLREQLSALRSGGDDFKPIEVDLVFPQIGPRTFCLDARPLSLQGQSGSRFLLALQDITARKKAEQAQRMLVGELQHRVKNTLATVQAIASQTLRSALPLERQSFIARLHALSNAHDVLAQDNWHRAPLREIVDHALAPFQKERIELSGPHVLLEASKALAMTMALHELATNAVKYGALSNTIGRVRVEWTVRRAGDSARLQLCWQERGGPPVREPDQKGFGSRLIEASLEESQVVFDPEGISCRLEVAL
jgi:two-component system, chemotaxis family, CheB/CheR fusion protein